MFRQFAILASLFVLLPNLADASCLRTNLTKCLDSACAINATTNRAARCQYCGAASANNNAQPDTGARSVSIGSSTKYIISSSELHDAPSDPGQRYVWATRLCLERVPDCTPDDVTETYDTLIEQSCTTMIQDEARAQEKKQNSANNQTQSSCSDKISLCMKTTARCGSDFSGCADDSAFTRNFSVCVTDARGCDKYASDIRAELVSRRDAAVKKQQDQMQRNVKEHAKKREETAQKNQKLCTNDAGRESCISEICATMPNNCGLGFADERSMATQLCKYWDTACATLK